ncbi:thyroid hormone receptor-associated protein 3-like isoform X1 [Acipenser oxyrinchus oxyrinchus]|uniref:Thyroid hormone receptor-associated protein 3-like isoform X1 n=1 Tax=Acipenser oxyrinchus oxyrinchus TaxID=40147 RepID=A0AAD8CWQ2_ACIOX|nr:thyroid hormone receptor-associated protein 3-like isoform X1 [Acipenser oxyrinchus oxyrinchus]
MSKVPKSKSASRSRSRSGSRSRSRSFSRSHSRTRSRSRSRKHRYSSRSRARSRSRSPPHNRERNYPREYQNNNREFRGYNRGYRRPYYYRGRGRGYFPRGRFQRGGGYGNGNYRPNWQNYRQQQPQQQQQPQHHQHSPRRGRSRSRTPKRRSGSPRSRSRSRYSDRSSSGHSRRSRRSSSSDSRSSSRHSRSGSSKRKTVKGQEQSGAAVSATMESQIAESKDEGSLSTANNENAPELSSASWQGLTTYDTSPKRASPVVRSAIIVSQSAAAARPSPALQSIAVRRPSPAQRGSQSPSRSSASAPSPALRSASWQSSGIGSSNKSPPQKQSPSAVFSGFGFFSKEESSRAGDTGSAVPSFKKYMEEQKSKTLLQEWENGREKDQKAIDLERDKGNGKAGTSERGAANITLKSEYYGKSEKEKYKHSNEAEEEHEKRYKVRSQKEREFEEDPKFKGKVTVTASRDQDALDERFNKWEEFAYFPTTKEKPRKVEDEDGGGDDDDDVEDELYRSMKEERAVAAAKKAEPSGYRGFSPEKIPKASRYKEKPGPSPSTPPRRSSENRERERLVARREESPPRATPPAFPGYRGSEVKLREDPFREESAGCSGVLANERRLSRDLVHPSKQDQEFRSIFQHIQAAQSRRSPSELFAQHIVTIVHHVKAQHFESSGMTLSERFALYQRKAAQKETPKTRKSPEIHRIIDVSPSAFRKHLHLFEEMKSSRESSYKGEDPKNKGDSVDLHLDIEHQKKYSSREREHKREGMRDSGDTSPSRERSTERAGKHHKESKKLKKRKKNRERSRSSSSSHSYKGRDYTEEVEDKEENFDKSQLGARDFSGPMERGRARGGFQFRIRGRSWNRGNYPGNNSNGNPPNPPMPIILKRSKEEEWDPEHTPKSKKYYLHDDREGEGDKKWADNRGRGRGTFQRGRGRFLHRKSGTSPKWTHDMFQGSGEEGELQDDDSETEHKEENKMSATAATEQ